MINTAKSAICLTILSNGKSELAGLYFKRIKNRNGGIENMKYNKEKLEQHIEELANMTMYVGDNIVWEGQCGQSDHFDKLSKPEQIALVDIFAKMKGLKESLTAYQSWFGNTK